MRIALPLLLLHSSPAYAGRYSEAIRDSGDGLAYLFWIPILLAVFMYKKFEKKGAGGFAAIAGGLGGLAFIHFFPLIAIAIVVIAFAGMIVVGFYDS